jgi:hypothetical protein
MSLPATLRVKISSEGAEMISMTPIVVRELAIDELLMYMLGYTGKNAARVSELLQRGVLVHGVSRFRWDGVTASEAEIEEVLNRLPGDEPQRPFDREKCTKIVLMGVNSQIELPKEAAEKRRFLRRRSFWDAVLESITQPVYQHFSYRERADCYRLRPAPPVIREQAPLLAYSGLQAQISAGTFDAVDLFVSR